MPRVEIDVETSAIGFDVKPVVNAVKGAIRSDAAAVLSVPGRQLGAGDFSFRVHYIVGQDEPIDHVEVTITGDADDDRIKRRDDIGLVIGQSVAKAVAKVDSSLSCNVTVLLGVVEYYSSRTGRIGTSAPQPASVPVHRSRCD